jgi:ABC-type dipeptide/oligopeptide/nickel transport system permease subunit
VNSDASKSDSTESISNSSKWVSRLKWTVIALLVMALTGGFFGALTTDLGFFTATINSAIAILKVGAALLAIYMLVYFPFIWLIRKWWLKYKASKPFSNDQTEKSITKFVSNGPSLFGVITIIYSILIAVFCYIIAPDSTSNTDRQIAEINKQKPGFEMDFLLVTNNLEEEHTSFLNRLVNGTSSHHNYVPFLNMAIEGDSVVLEHFGGNNMANDRLAFELIDVAFSKSFRETGISRKGDVYSFYNVENQVQEVSRDELLKLVETKHVKSKTFWFGTDQAGRDYLSRIMLGSRVSISVGILAVTVALLIGLVLGCVAGFYRGWIDEIIVWFINVFWSIPTLLLVLPISFAFGSQPWTIYLAVGLTMWVDIARIVRGQVLGVREMEYVDAARSLGYSNFRTIFKHILPNITGPVIVVTAANFAYAILIEAGLSFLGIGTNPPKPTWGQMIAKNKDNIAYGDPHLALIPGFAIVLLVLSFFLIGNGLRDALDAKTKIDH